MGKRRYEPELEEEEPALPQKSSMSFLMIGGMLLIAITCYQYQSMLAAAPTEATLELMEERVLRGEAAAIPAKRTITGMHKAAGRGMSAVKARIKKNQDFSEVHMEDDDGETPVFKAARAGLHSAIELLVDAAGAKLNTKNRFGQTPLFVALHEYESHANNESQKMLLEKGADPNVTIGKGRTAFTLLQWAIDNENSEAVLLLLHHGVCIDCQGEIGKTALQVAVDRTGAGLEMVNLLIKANASLNSLDADTGSTALHMAVNHQNVAVIRALVAAGADVSIKEDMFGHSPIDLTKNLRKNKKSILLALGVEEKAADEPTLKN